MTDVNEARKNLDLVLTDDLRRQYFGLLREWFLFRLPISKIQFIGAVRKIFKDEQLKYHNHYILALMAKVCPSHAKNMRMSSDKGSYEMADYTDYISPSSPPIVPPNIMSRSAASEFYLPDSGFISTLVDIHAWENGLDGAAENVPEYLVMICQMFIKNILTAMISKKESYKVRDGNFQYGFGFPVPDPLIRNTHNIIDQTQESKVDVMDDDDSFIPKYRPTLEDIEQQTAFAYACGKRSYSDEKLTVKLLYETLRDNPNIIGLHSIHSTNMLKIGLNLEES